MTNNVRHFLRQISPTILQAYFESKGSIISAGLLKLRQLPLARHLADRIMSGEDQASQAVLGDVARLLPMASERGRNALLNAASNEPLVKEKFRALANDYERALWMLMTHEVLFRDGEGLHFFDYYAEGSRGRYYRTQADLPVSRAEDDVTEFSTSVCQFYRGQDGSGVSCRVEFTDRLAEGTIQVTLYVQGLPSHITELVNGDFKRRISHPTVDAAIVYSPSDGHTTTVAKGGARVHDALREAFARKLLKIEPKFDIVSRRRFRLESLKSSRVLHADPCVGIKCVRVRKLTLAPPSSRSGFLTIEAPARQPDIGVYDIGNRWFQEKARLYEKFNVVSATIALHFHPPPGATRPRTINLELSPTTSNLKNLTEADRRIAETLIDEWQLAESAL
jgi:hypothetical protein